MKSRWLQRKRVESPLMKATSKGRRGEKIEITAVLVHTRRANRWSARGRRKTIAVVVGRWLVDSSVVKGGTRSRRTVDEMQMSPELAACSVSSRQPAAFSCSLALLYWMMTPWHSAIGPFISYAATLPGYFWGGPQKFQTDW